MGSDKVMEFTDANFEAEVLQSPVPVLVDFWAEWCMPCHMIAPIVEQLAEEYDGRFKVGRLNVDDNRQTTVNFRIMSIPALLMFKGGQVVKKMVGANKARKEFQAVMDGLLE